MGDAYFTAKEVRMWVPIISLGNFAGDAYFTELIFVRDTGKFCYRKRQNHTDFVTHKYGLMQFMKLSFGLLVIVLLD